jgi:selenocysteine lyase/cysteine desulfurase
VVPFGHGLLDHWQMAKGYVNLNHGSYGATPKAVTAGLRRHYDEQEMLPDYWFRYNGNNRTLYGALDDVRARVAKMINANSSDDVVFVDNASGGINAVLRSVTLTPQDRILYLNLAYGMVKTTIKYVHEHDHGEVPLQTHVKVPGSDDAIVAAVTAALEANPSVKIASFSHISSIPAVILPVKRLAAACRERGVLVMIDGEAATLRHSPPLALLSAGHAVTHTAVTGSAAVTHFLTGAHALGAIPIDVQALGADFYIANGHKVGVLLSV